VHLVQTHVSLIFITDNYVYKIKKPVDLGFLNFTTLDRRRFYCAEEIRLNRRLCPDIYLGIAEVRDSERGASFDGEGEVIDYAVKMKRLPEERMMEHLLQENSLVDEDIRRIARTIGEFHLKADQGEEINCYGSPEAIRHNWDESFRQISEFVPAVIAVADLRILMAWVDAFLAENQNLFAERISQGFIRDCDGDIHMGNICLTDRICIFDCIEFNNRFRYSDTAADIAFLLMDFDFHARRDFSGIFLSAYIETTGDCGITKVLDFYKIYRAVVRGKVECFKLRDPDIPDDARHEAEARALRYFRLARGYVIRRKLPPTLIITSGLMGSGKSSTAAELAFELGMQLYSSDAARKEIAHIPAHSHDFSGYGQGIYSAGFNQETYDTLCASAAKSLEAGQSVIIDATFQRKIDRTRFRALAEKLSAPFYIVKTDCPESLIKERLGKRMTRRATISDGRWELFRQQSEEFEPLGVDEGKQICIDTSLPARDTIDTILHSMEIL
jgi:aminoglycoside phosphotransferase family enzyme/predicted kinase